MILLWYYTIVAFFSLAKLLGKAGGALARSSLWLNAWCMREAEQLRELVERQL